MVKTEKSPIKLEKLEKLTKNGRIKEEKVNFYIYQRL